VDLYLYLFPFAKICVHLRFNESSLVVPLRAGSTHCAANWHIGTLANYSLLSNFIIEGIKNASVPVNTMAIPHIANTLATPIASAINPVAINPKIEGSKLILSNNENTRPRKEASILV